MQRALSLMLLLAYFAPIDGWSVTVIRVPQDVTTIQAAVDQAQGGDIILIRPGNYAESVVVTKSGISLIGDVPADPFSRPSDERVVLDGEVNRETGLHLRGTATVPVRDVTVRGLWVRQFLRGIVLENVQRSRVELNETSDNYDLAAARPPTFPNGITLIGSSFNSIISNRSHDNGHDGILLQTGSHANIIRENVILRAHPQANARTGVEHIGCGIQIADSNYNVVSGNQSDEADWGIRSGGTATGNVFRQNTARGSHRVGIQALGAANWNIFEANEATGNGTLGLSPSSSTARFDLFDDGVLNNLWWRNNVGTSNSEPAVATVRFEPASVQVGQSFSASLSGTNLIRQTYFDVRFRRPGSATDEVALDLQLGTFASHIVVSGTLAGAWTVTGIRPHLDTNDHTGDFIFVSATLSVIP